ncbi:hypothetical protein FNH05_28725 [Amycolatopsis rhizosphaerae]|uniref:Uncharacterized protein n=1 Tax=Amycolatopsis rhizosphaerae TaxID=2053003 RepID=A0A558B3A5_9PSEU|nr:hypothetical protein [Amycolatopsis rhizosphaerae]TVT30988.1 hypothetical protein FNH05_28725 [Amycolatopsis rhizosphaerae]
MPSLLTRHRMVTVPAHGLLTLRDADIDAPDAPVDNTAALAEATRSVAAGTGDELYVSTAQDLLPVVVDVYTAAVFHEGREQAAAQRERLLTEAPGDMGAAARIHAGLERYTIQVWRTADLSDDDTDD